MRKNLIFRFARYIVNSLDDKELKNTGFHFISEAFFRISSLLLFTKDMRSMEPFLM